MATAAAEPAPVTNGTAPIASPLSVPEEVAQPASGTKRKREDSAPQTDATVEGSAPAPVKEASNAQVQDSLRDILKVLRKYV